MTSLRPGQLPQCEGLFDRPIGKRE